MADKPRDADGHALLGDCLLASGDTAGAQHAFRAALKLDRGHADAATGLADLLDAAGLPSDAERVLRAALEANRRSSRLAARLANALTASGKPDQALPITKSLAAGTRPDHAVLHAHALALQTAGQRRQAVTVYQRAAALYPDSAAAHHNLAAIHGDLGEFSAAERSAARALSRGGNSAETWLVYARALLGRSRLDEAERAFREVIRRAPAYAEAHRDLAQLIWMRTENAAAAVAVLDQAIRADPRRHPLWSLRANVLQHAGDTQGAYTTLLQAIDHFPDEPSLRVAAAHLAALHGAPGDALAHAERATLLWPHDDAPRHALFAACLAVGDPTRAAAIADALVARQPLDQRALAYQATARRLLGDVRYRDLYDYEAFVRAWRMDVPDGWSDLAAYLLDLARALDEAHLFRTHPLDQSLRHGSQAAHLLTSENPAIRAFPQAVDGPIRRHLAALGRGPDPVRVRNTGRYRFHGMWSVRLRPGGFHTDHIHPEGWLSSACYIALPPTDDHRTAAREAWIKFGQPGLSTVPPLAPEHFMKPEPGLLVLFPSCMWHGTMPFEGEAKRLSVAFDLLP